MEFEILTVDDQAMDRKILSKMLAKFFPDVTIHEAENGQLAIDFLKQYDQTLIKENVSVKMPLVIFLDINMPVMNGFEFLDVLYAEVKSELIVLDPIVVSMLSSSKNEEDIAKAKTYGIVKDFVTKYPKDKTQLKLTIENALKGS